MKEGGTVRRPASTSPGTQTLTSGVTARLREWNESGRLSALSPIGVLIVMIIVMTIGNTNFLTLGNFENIFVQIVTLLIMGLGQTFVILMGGIDLSVAAIASFSSIMTALLLPSLGYGCFIVGILSGTAAGLLTGIVHARARIPSFVASLGAMGVWTGVGFTVSNATPIEVLQVNGHFLEWVTGHTLTIPNEIIIGFLVLALCFVLQRYTHFGRSIMAIGAGETAAKLSGVDVAKYKTLAFVLSGTLAAFCGVVLACRMSGGSARIADGFQLKAIAIVILGGTSISGGVGGVSRTVVGALLIAVLDTGMNVVGVDVYAQQVVYGAILILAVALTIDRAKMPIIK
jgi:ribose transport system permease protein